MSDLEKMNGAMALNGLGSSNGRQQQEEGAPASTMAAGSNVGEAIAAGAADPSSTTAAAGTEAMAAAAATGGGGTLKAVESAISFSSMAGDDAGTDAGISSVPPSEAGGHPPLDTACSDGGGPSSMVGGMVGPPSPLTGCYLLIILGEPHSEEHKDNILQHLLKGKCKI